MKIPFVYLNVIKKNLFLKKKKETKKTMTKQTMVTNTFS